MDEKKLRMFSFLVFTKLEGAVTAGMVHLGDKLGLYVALRDAGKPLHSDELAQRAGLHERWVREWAYNQAAARIIDCDDEERFSLSDEAAAVLATPDHPAYGMGMFHRFPNTMDTLRAMPESFRTGHGHDYDSHGPRSRGWYRAVVRTMEPHEPAAGGAAPRSTASPSGSPRARRPRTSAVVRGSTAADGRRVPEESVPRVRHQPVRARSRGGEAARRPRRRTCRSTTRETSRCPMTDQSGSSRRLIASTTMTHPFEMMQALRRAITPDGTWLLVDIKAHDTFALNASENPMASLMYGISVSVVHVVGDVGA